MRKEIVLFLFFLSLNLFSVESINVKSEISKSEAKLGEKILLKMFFEDNRVKDTKILWNKIVFNNGVPEVLSYKDEVKNNILNVEITLAFYDAGEYKDFNVELMASIKDEVLFKLVSNKYDIKIISPLTDEEIEVIKKIEDKSKIELKKQKEQAEIPFQFSFYLIILLIGLGIILLFLIMYYIFYNLIFKKKNDKVASLIPPYEEFLSKVEKVKFEKNEDRKETELKLSLLTEYLKELIYKEFSFNAPSETTKELINSLREQAFTPELITSIRNLLEEIDLIKFAKAPYDIENLNEQKKKIVKLGQEIHLYKKSKEVGEKKLNENN